MAQITGTSNLGGGIHLLYGFSAYFRPPRTFCTPSALAPTRTRTRASASATGARPLRLVVWPVQRGYGSQAQLFSLSAIGSGSGREWRGQGAGEALVN